MTMTLELSPEQERALRQAAEQQQTSPEDVVMKLVGQLVKDDASDGGARSERVRTAGDYVQQKNAKLYERLA